HWDGEHGFLYMPPDKTTDRPAVTLNGSIGHISHAVFKGYHDSAPVPLRQMVANVLKRLLPEPVAVADGLPSFGRLTVTEQDGRRMVHVLSYVPERRGPNMDMIEEPVELRDVAVRLRVDGLPPQRAYLAPQREELRFRIEDGYAVTTIPRVPGYAMVVFEESGRTK
ncbi:hypothetical protein ACFLSJ_09230, partial [Verrucomicrobiota bacterium]